MHIKRPSSFLAVLALALLPTLTTACGGSSDGAKSGDPSSTSGSTASRGNVDGTLALGQLAPQSGSISSIAPSLTTPVRIAVDEINAAGGVNGRPIALAVADDGGGDNPPVATASLDTLLNTSKVDAIVGPSASGTALDLLGTIRRDGVLTCSGSTSAEELSVADSGGYFFRTAPPDRLQALALARLVVAQGKHQPVIIARDDGYGDAFVAPLARELRKLDAAPVGPVIRYKPTARNLAGIGKRVASRHPDSVITISLPDDGARIVQSLIAAGVGPAQVPLYTADGMQSTTFHTKVDPANPAQVGGIVGTAPAAAPAGPESAFTNALRKAGVAPIFSAYYYDCAILTALAAVQAKSDDPAKMKAAFAKSLRGTTDCATFAECTQALAAGKTIHYRGASSAFDHWNGSEPGDGTYDVWSYGGAGNVVTGTPSQQIKVP
jgi:branched-chain amino acid transport system substrate-binding protein